MTTSESKEQFFSMSQDGKPTRREKMSSRKMLYTCLLAIFAVLLWAGPSGAVITGTAHETAVGAAGACSACHIPHGGGTDRLWPSTPGGGTYTGTVAGLCSSCHYSDGGYAASMSAAASDTFVYHANSHGTLMNRGNEPWSTDVDASGLPYATQGLNFECTSCHNVHDDTNRPFLRDSTEALCARCHTNRHFVGGTLSEGGSVTPGAWGGLSNTGASNPGSHPIGTDITGELDTGSPDSVVTIPTSLDIVRSADVAGWVLGPKTTATGGGVTCVTCHAVHGAQDDGDNTGGNVPAADTSPNVNYLAVAQASVAAAWTDPGGGSQRSVANGNGDFNALCETCHGVGNNPASDPQGAFSDATHNVNPGAASTFSHPIDTYGASSAAGVTEFSALMPWPVGGGMTAGANVDPIPICESCHAPHPAAELEAPVRTDVGPDGGPWLLRGSTAGSFCQECHTAFASHHPVGMTYNSAGASYLANASGGAGDTLDCTTCHSGAHNWSAASAVALDGSWVPTDNGRSTTQATDMFNADMSKTCMDCHYGMDGHAASVSPTLGTGATVTLEADFQTVDQSMGTHYIGLIHDTNTNWYGSAGDAPTVSIYNTGANWSGVDTAYADGWSRFGGTNSADNRVIVCESCHELEPDKNKGITHLLLAPYTEGSNGDDGDTDGRDDLCEACHGVPPGTHAVTGKTVSRTGTTPNTSASWLRSPIIGDATLGTNKISCDSCHQPHDANSASYTFILDAPVSIATPSINPVVGAGTVETTNPAETPAYADTTYATPTLASAL